MSRNASPEMIAAMREGVAILEQSLAPEAGPAAARLRVRRDYLARVLEGTSALSLHHPLRRRLCAQVCYSAMTGGILFLPEERYLALRRRLLDVAKSIGEDVFADSYSEALEWFSLLLAKAAASPEVSQQTVAHMSRRAGLAAPALPSVLRNC